MDQAKVRECMQADLEAAGLDSAKYFPELWKCMICGLQYSKYRTAVLHVNRLHSRIELEQEPMPVIICDEAL